MLASFLHSRFPYKQSRLINLREEDWLPRLRHSYDANLASAGHSDRPEVLTEVETVSWVGLIWIQFDFT